ncbi:hypothetical protein NQ318_017637 [Aromia moschata]|uniref:DUF659 domain-containing protein n=1 Tax=Aromia moschata TaxID=1265417 RepID=A0AAV8Z314_9CUCU|nr:hypothetical protein NQ318_017637 [Aromia moschata]
MIVEDTYNYKKWCIPENPVHSSGINTLKWSYPVAQRYVPTYHVYVKRLSLCVDEIICRKKHSVVNVLVRVMDYTKPTSPLLLASKRLQKCSAEAITRVILETLENSQLLTSQVFLFVTDGAATMLSVGRSLKEHGCSFFHVTCKLHALHLVSETIRNCFPEVDALISSTKKVFLKSPKRLRAFHTQCPGVSEPPQPIITRWGTWLEAAFY